MARPTFTCLAHHPSRLCRSHCLPLPSFSTQPTLVNYVIGKMQARASPQEIEEELSKVLDDEAGPFMLKLWRMLLFEILRAKAIAERAAATFIPRA
eukprot:scaffold66006_cov32-Tisochrysis_lutea.AAC.1